MTTLRRARRRLRWYAVLAVAAAAAALLAFYAREYVANASVHAYLRTLPAPARRDRLLVVAPHPDDEVLGAGGYLARTVRAGGQVRVVVVTSGDGFRRAAMAYFHTLDPPPRDFVRLGYARERESLAALARLGVPAGRVSFLGFPDGGTRALWEGGFTAAHPYRSRYTRVDHVPYRDAYRPGAPYDATALEAELSDLIRAFRPTVVALPDPNDFNPDHQAVGEFTMMALAGLGDLGPGGPRLELYLVHHGEWPTPFGDHPTAFLVPPSDLYRAERGWSSLPLRQRDEEAKRRAILRYRSQMQVMGDWLLGFDRRNELFVPAAVRRIPVLATGYDFPGGGLPPEALTVLAPEPNPLRAVEPGANLSGSHVFVADGRLWTVLSLRGDAAPGDTYRLELRTAAPAGGARLDMVARRLALEGPAPAGGRFAASGRLAAFSLPLADLAGSSLVYVRTRAVSQAATVWTPWEMFRLPGAGSG